MALFLKNSTNEDDINICSVTDCTSLYYCKTVRQLLCALLLASQKPKSTKKYLFISTWLYGLFPGLKQFICNDEWNFVNILTYDSFKVSPYHNDDPKVLLQNIELYFDKIFADNNIDIKCIKEFNLFSSLRFGLYLSLKQIMFNLFEDSNGTAEKNGLVQWRENTDKVTKRDLAVRFGLINGDSKFVDKIFVCSEPVPKKIPKNKIHDFTIQSAIQKTDAKTLVSLFNFFNADSASQSNDVRCFDHVILSQYYGIKTNLPVANFWGAIADCFVPDNKKCSIKPHPADTTDFSNVFAQDEIINKNIPFELFDSATKIEKTISISSTAASSSAKSVVLGSEYINFDLFYNYAALLMLSNTIGNAKVSYSGTHPNIFEHLINGNLKNNNLLYSADCDHADVQIVDNKPINSILHKAKNLTVVYSIKKDDYNRMKSTDLKDQVFLSIKAKLNSDVIYDRIIVIYNHDNKLDIFRNVNIDVTLKRSCISLEIRNYSASEAVIDDVRDLQAKCDQLSQKIESIEKNIADNNAYNEEKLLAKIANLLNEHLWPMGDRIKMLLKANSVSEIHHKAFERFKGVNAGKDVVLIGTGPSLNKFSPIPDCKYCGLNKAYLYDKVKLDYYFTADHIAVKDCLQEIREIACEKFYGMIDPKYSECVISEQDALAANAHRFYLAGIEQPIRYVVDICNEQLGDSGSIAFSAMQFLLWTNPKRIYLVGCDCTKNIHFSDAAEKEHSQPEINQTQYNGWVAMKEFAKLYYPHTQIISVNPVGLKGLYEDIFTE